LLRNEFIPAETVDHFVTKNLERNTGDRPSKKMFYSRPARPGKQELMEEHHKILAERALSKEQDKKIILDIGKQE
jgi:hypothetical protein